MVSVIAALFVEKHGVYDIPGVDVWDIERDARNYAGPHPVVAHPPCERWGKYWAGSPLAINRGAKQKTLGADHGCFGAALRAVRTYGGVIEHPQYSRAWRVFGLREPYIKGAWSATGDGGWTCCVEQGRYGHPIRKLTWLYAYGCDDLPSLDWGITTIPGLGRMGEMARMRSRYARRATPEPFRDLLISIASTARPQP